MAKGDNSKLAVNIVRARHLEITVDQTFLVTEDVVET